MTFNNKSTGAPLADRVYRARVSGGGKKLVVFINRQAVEVSFKADVIIAPPPPPIYPPMPVGSVIAPSAFGSALAAAKPGDVLQLSRGVLYAMPSSPKFAANVTIKGGTFAAMNLQDAENITLDGQIFDYTFRAGDPLHVSPFQISGGRNIAIRNAVFDGDMARGMSVIDDGYACGRGLIVSGVDGITVADCIFAKWHRGMIIGESSNIAVLRNDVSGIRSDGMDFMQVRKILIEGNNIHDFRSAPGSADHPDMIQFWTTGTTTPSSDITIRNNKLDVGQGSFTQSLFMRNELGEGGNTSIYYRNILIENNTIRNAHIHGITVGETIGLYVRKNAVIAAVLNAADPTNAEYIAQFGAQTGIMVPAINMSKASTGEVTGNAFAGANWRIGARIDMGSSKMVLGSNPTVSAESLIPAGIGAQ